MNTHMMKVGLRYGTNLFARVAQQRGIWYALSVCSRFFIAEAAKLSKLTPGWKSNVRARGKHPVMHSGQIVAAVQKLGVHWQEYDINLARFNQHMLTNDYPKNYAAGPMDEGGMREEKLLEYFVSLDLLQPRAEDIILDVASEWSVFPQTVRRLVGSIVYQQDLIYPPGIHGFQIGGSAAHMPIPANFTDKIVLHNAFEHFEGTADTDFIREAWRILKPGGRACILPLFLSERHTNLTDPLVRRDGVQWDPEAEVVELPWWHNRFGRFYDAATLRQRVLDPALTLGFRAQIIHFTNVQTVHPNACLFFALILDKG